ncbi:hypothetical protein RUM44_010843 [Polyplax serrata]|uniref:Uncharacterized protein n=1 Tax=Polyplax serrata TaxID=468196 RepID=A0ABR1ANF9_POLSC
MKKLDDRKIRTEATTTPVGAFYFHKRGDSAVKKIERPQKVEWFIADGRRIGKSRMLTKSKFVAALYEQQEDEKAERWKGKWGKIRMELDDMPGKIFGGLEGKPRPGDE